MSYNSVLTQIDDNVVANANNEITADVLRPILEAMLGFANDYIGDLTTLDTTEKGNLVDALNEVLSGIGNGITIHTGTANPNVTPPASYDLGDFYNRTSAGSTIQFYIYNNNEWVLLVNVSSQASYKSSYRLDGSDYVVQETDYLIVMQDNVQSRNLTLPNPSSYEGRQFVLLNITNTFDINLNYSINDFDLSGIATVGPNTSYLIQVHQGAYYRLT